MYKVPASAIISERFAGATSTWSPFFRPSSSSASLPHSLFRHCISPRQRSCWRLSSVPKDIIETTVISYADQQIEIVQGRVMTVESLLNIVHDIDPYPKHQDWSANDKAQRILDNTSLERVDAVTLKPTQESNAFSLHYDNPDPKIAAAIDNRLAQLFLTYNQRVRTQAAGEAAGFLQKQSEGIAQQMREVDVRIAEVKRKYGEAMPELQLRNQSAVEDFQRQLDALQQQILAAQEKESVLALAAQSDESEFDHRVRRSHGCGDGAG